MRIRPVESGDFGVIAAITNPFILRTTVHFGYEPVTAEELRAAWRKHEATHPYLVAVSEGGEVVGYAKAGPWRERAAYGRTAEVGIYLAEGARGAGLGKRLYGELIAACRAKGFHTVVGGLTLPNEASRRLHEAMGFTLVGVFREVGWKFEAWRDVAFYQLALE